MPFGEAASNNYGTNSASMGESHRRQDTPQQPLRNRPHIRGGASSPGDLLFSHPHSSFDEFPYPPYSELPFTTLRRRKQGNQFVKWAMRAVLASPVVVLVFWSIGAMIFSKNVGHRSRHNAATTTTARNNMRAAFRRLPDSSQLAAQPQQPLLQPLVMMPQNQMYALQQTNMAAPALMMNPQEIQLQQKQQQQQQLQPQMQIQQFQMQQAYGLPQQQQAMGNAANVVPSNYYASVNSNARGVMPLMSQQEPVVLQPPLQQATAQQGLVVQPQAYQSATILSPPQQLEQEPQVQPPPEQIPVVMQEQLLGAAPLANDPMGNTGPVTQNLPTPRGDVTVLYYDPKQTVAGPNGQVRLPTTVYDSQGNPVDLVGLAAQSQAQILIEPPMVQAQEPPSRTLIQQQELEIPSAQLATPDIKKWGESTAQDQSIIISTVAVMALLVGALSARRMRNRSVLSACIENESLEDDVAYDAAYSTTLPQADGGSYNTFGGGWKGDLEKFDV